MMEHKLALGEEVVVEGETLGEEEVCNTVVGRFSYSSEYTLAGKVGVEVQGDQDIRVFREVPLVPWVPYIQGRLGIPDIREVRVVPCILAVREVLAVGKVQGMVVAVAEVGVVAGHSMMVCKREHMRQDIQNHRD